MHVTVIGYNQKLNVLTNFS